MPSRIPWARALLLLGVLAPLPAAAQDDIEPMDEGTWTGLVIPPGDEMMDLEYVVSYGDDGLGIELVPPPEMGGSVFATEVLHDGQTLSFMLDVGQAVSCVLYLEEDGHFEGECVDSFGEGAVMTMYPPGDGD